MFAGPLLILLNKFILSNLNFPYPMFLSALGVVFSAAGENRGDARDSEIAKERASVWVTLCEKGASCRIFMRLLYHLGIWCICIPMWASFRCSSFAGDYVSMFKCSRVRISAQMTILGIVYIS